MIRIMLTYERSRAWGVKKCDIHRRIGCRAWHMLQYRALHRPCNAGTSTAKPSCLYSSLLYALHIDNSSVPSLVWRDQHGQAVMFVSLFLYALYSILYALYSNSQLIYPVFGVTGRAGPSRHIFIAPYYTPSATCYSNTVFGIGSFCGSFQGFFLWYYGTKAGNRY